MLLSDEEILHRVDTHVGEPNQKYPLNGSDWKNFARAIEAAILAKLASAELPEPLVWRHEGYEGWNASEFIEEDTIETYTADQLRQAYAQGFAAGAASQLSAEPVAHLRKNGFRFLGDFEPQDDSELPLYTRREA